MQPGETARDDAAAAAPPPLVKRLIVDANVFIKTLKIEEIAEAAFTVPEVVAEIRDDAAKRCLEHFPIPLTIVEASAPSCTATAQFAKKTGEFKSLSLPDLHLIALARDLDIEFRGGSDAHLRTDPKVGKTGKRKAGAKPKRTTAAVQPTAADEEGWTVAKSSRKPKPQKKSRTRRAAPKAAPVVAAGDAPAPAAPTAAPAPEPTVPAAPTEDDPFPARRSEGAAEPSAGVQLGGDMSGRWITPDTLGAGAVAKAARRHPPVALMTSDFSMQNVAIQMGLRVLSPDGRRIKYTRTYTQQCHACGRVLDAPQDSPFCPHCGNRALIRLSYTVDGRGVRHYPQRELRFNNRGKQFSLPKPRAGRTGAPLIEPVIAEYQTDAAYRLAQQRRAKEERRAAGAAAADAFDGCADSFFSGRISGPTADKKMRSNVVPYFERANPNEARRRRGKRRRNRNRPY